MFVAAEEETLKLDKYDQMTLRLSMENTAS